jgi:hypothetical protein
MGRLALYQEMLKEKKGCYSPDFNALFIQVIFKGSYVALPPVLVDIGEYDPDDTPKNQENCFLLK